MKTTLSLFVLAALQLSACRTAGGGNSVADVKAVQDTRSSDVRAVCNNMIVPQIRNDCLNTIRDKRYQKDVANICNIIVPQEAVSCLAAAAGKLYSPDEVSQCGNFFVSQEKVQCMQDSGFAVSTGPDDTSATDVCQRGVFDSGISARCRTAANGSFSAQAPSLCNAIFSEASRADCLRALAGKDVPADGLANCFQNNDDAGLLACAKAFKGPTTSQPVNNSSFCADIIVPQLKTQCLGIVNSGRIAQNAGKLCKGIFVPQLRIQCFSAILDRKFSDDEVNSCANPVPQQLIECISQAGR